MQTMQNYIYFLLAFLVISTSMIGGSEAGNETNDDNSDDNDSGENNDDTSESNDSNETNGDNSDDNNSNETNGDNNTSSGTNETNEKLDYCPDEINEDNENLVDDACVVPVDEDDTVEKDEEGFLFSLSTLLAICTLGLIAIKRR
tara:strand:+ start:2539 stop:2973 length:435 start_codon:yes stop_codon:yes gene_type:complete